MTWYVSEEKEAMEHVYPWEGQHATKGVDSMEFCNLLVGLILCNHFAGTSHPLDTQCVQESTGLLYLKKGSSNRGLQLLRGSQANFQRGGGSLQLVGIKSTEFLFPAFIEVSEVYLSLALQTLTSGTKKQLYTFCIFFKCTAIAGQQY